MPSGVIFNDPTTLKEFGFNNDLGAVITLTAAGVGTTNSADIINYAGRGAKIAINVTAITGTVPTLTVTVQGKDSVSGTYYTLLASTAIAATGFTSLDVYPGIVAAANAIANLTVPRIFRVIATVAGTGPAVTATIGCVVMQ